MEMTQPQPVAVLVANIAVYTATLFVIVSEVAVLVAKFAAGTATSFLINSPAHFYDRAM
jgi:hypothetical protein